MSQKELLKLAIMFRAAHKQRELLLLHAPEPDAQAAYDQRLSGLTLTLIALGYELAERTLVASMTAAVMSAPDGARVSA